jgi:hypothetical protein
MHPQISRSLADERISDLRRQAVRYAAAHRDRDRSRAPRLRRRIGLVMIDAGSRMLATAPAREHRSAATVAARGPRREGSAGLAPRRAGPVAGPALLARPGRFRRP